MSIDIKKVFEDYRVAKKLEQLKRAGYLEGLEAAAKLAETSGYERIARDIRALKS